MKELRIILLLCFIALSSNSLLAQTPLTHHGPFYVGLGGARAIYGNNNRLFINASEGGLWYTDDRQSWKKPNSYIDNAVDFFKDGEGNLFTHNFRDLVFRSTDNGESWTSFTVILTDGGSGPVTFVTDLRSIGVAGDTIFVARYEGLGYFVAGVDNDQGYAIHEFDGKFIRAMAVDHNNIILAVDGEQKLRYSSDRGATWTEKEVPFGDNPVSEIIIAGDKIWVRAFKVWYSDNQGDTWDRKDIDDYGVSDISWSGDKLYAAAAGVFSFSETEDQWTPILTENGQTGVMHVATEGDKLFAILPSGGSVDQNPGHFVESTNEGETWNDVSLAGYAHGAVREFAVDSEGTIYISTSNYIFRKRKNETIFEMFIGAGYSGIIIENDILYVGSSGQAKAYNSKTGEPILIDIPYSFEAFDSDDIVKAGDYFFVNSYSSGVWRVSEGQNYIPFSSGLPGGTTIRSLRIHNGNLYATSNTGVYRTSVESASWQKIYPTSGNEDIVAVAFNGNTIVTSVAVSHDNGSTWQDFNVNDHFYDISYADDQFVAVGFGKIFVSRDDGNTWATASLASGIPLFGWSMLQTDDEIYIGASGTGTWSMKKTDLETITGVEETIDAQVLVYPNPTVDQVNIVTPIAGNIELLDILGVPVANRVSSAMHPEQFNIQSLSKGLYMFRVNLNGKTIVRKFVKQ